MWAAFLLYAARKIMEGIVMVELAGNLGIMADDILTYGKSVDTETVVRMGVSLLVLLVIIPLTETFAELLMFKQSLPYCEMVTRRFMKKSYSEVKRFDAGEAEYRLEQDPIDFYITLSNITVEILFIPAVTAFLILNVKGSNIIYILVAFLLSWIRVLLPLLQQKKLKKFDEEKRRFATDLKTAELVFAEKTEAFAALGIRDGWIDHMRKLFSIYFKKIGARFIAFSVRYEKTKNALSLVTDLLIIIAGAVLVTEKMINPGQVILMMGVLPVLQMLNESLIQIIEKKPEIDNLYVRMEELYSEPERSGQKEIDGIDEISFKDVSYSYDDENETAKLDLDYKAGDKILILGENGVGKTTFFKVLLGLLPGYKGEVKINGQNFDDISISSLRRKIGYVTQNPYIFKDTVRNNVVMGDERLKEEEIDNALKKFGLLDIKDREVTNESLSGGEKQRVSLARAFARRPSLWLFDEPNNSLDEETRIELAAFINELSTGAIVILHDKETIEQIGSDKVITLSR